MEKVTLEKTHALLEKLAEYVMTQVPTRQEMNELRQEMNERFEQVDKRFEQIDKSFEHIHKQLDLIRTEQHVFSETFKLHHKRLELLEDESPSYRVRDKDDKYE